MGRMAAALALVVSLGFARVAGAVTLDGFWYVLVHYQDSETAKPEQWRWDDRVWKFETKGDRLEWSEWPIVVLDDESGRFEPTRGGRATRVLGPWEPSPSQLADIQDGVQVNSRGSKTKTLRAESGGTKWSSGAGAAADSALVVTYSETWEIAGLPEAPVFSRDDSMGSGVTESMSGRTVWATENVGPNGDEISGRFERDGTRTGRFKLIRAGGTEALKGAAKTQSERQRMVFQRSMDAASDADVAQIFAGQVQLPAAAADADREKARGAIRGAVEAAVRANGNDPRDASALVERMTRVIERALFDEGKSLAEVQEQLATGQLGK
jgi:hypothetical protein